MSDFERLMFAVTTGNKEDIINIVNSGVNVNIRDEYGGSVLHFGEFWIPRRKLYTTSENHTVHTSSLLLSMGAEINAVNCRNVTPLHVAVMMGNLEVAEYLVQNGADTSIKSLTGDTPLDFTELFQEYEIREMLMRY